jgi:hypothetical protein
MALLELKDDGRGPSQQRVGKIAAKARRIAR